jgi:hypothetical protein
MGHFAHFRACALLYKKAVTRSKTAILRLEPNCPKMLFGGVSQVFIEALSIFTQPALHTFGGVRYINDQTAIITKQ